MISAQTVGSLVFVTSEANTKPYKKGLSTMNCLKTASSLSWFLDVGYHYGTMTETQARKLSGVHRTTWERYRAGKIAAPPALLELLRLTAYGEPPGGFDSKCWEGFRFQNGVLISPFGDVFTPAELRSFWIYRRSTEPYGVIAADESRRAAAEANINQQQQKEFKLCVL